MRRKNGDVIDKINDAVVRGKGVTLSVVELLDLAQELNDQSQRAMTHEAMLHTFVQRAYGQTSLAVH